MKQCPAVHRLDLPSDLLQRLHRANLIIHMHYTDQHGIRPDRSGNLRGFDDSGAVRCNKGNLPAKLLQLKTALID
jgi:hypothetical protein